MFAGGRGNGKLNDFPNRKVGAAAVKRKFLSAMIRLETMMKLRWRKCFHCGELTASSSLLPRSLDLLVFASLKFSLALGL
jgi:hypothetical protein